MERPAEGPLRESERMEGALTPTLSRKREREKKRRHLARWRLPEINQIFNRRC